MGSNPVEAARIFQVSISVRGSLLSYRHLQLPVHTRDKNMFCRPIKIQRFHTQTSKFTRPLGNVLAPVTQMIVADLFAVWQDMAFTLNKLGRNFKQGVQN